MLRPNQQKLKPQPPWQDKKEAPDFQGFLYQTQLVAGLPAIE